jgi:hypothetical protein
VKRLIDEMPILQHLKAGKGQRDSLIMFDVGPARTSKANCRARNGRCSSRTTMRALSIGTPMRLIARGSPPTHRAFCRRTAGWRPAPAQRKAGLFAVPKDSHSERALKDVRDLSEPIQQELEKFFKATDELEDKKLNVIGWKGPKAAVEAIKDAAKVFKKYGK